MPNLKFDLNSLVDSLKGLFTKAESPIQNSAQASLVQEHGYTKFEKSFIAFGLFLFLLGGYLFLFQAEHLGVAFGLLVESKQAPLGRLEFGQNSVKRKPLSAQNFVTLNSQQKVYDRDTILTDDGAQAIFSLNDGGVLNLGPNTLVELIAKDPNPLDGTAPQLVLNVKKGEVTGEGVNNLTLLKDGKKTELAKPKAGALLSKIAEKPKAALQSDCKIKTELLGIGKLSLTAVCDSETSSTAKVTVLDLTNREMMSNQLLPIKVNFAVPGNYTVKFDNLLAPDQTVVVPAEWEGLSFTNQTLNCDGKLNWKYNDPQGQEPNQFILDSPALPATKDTIIQGTSASAVELLSSFPTQVRVKSVPNDSGFLYVSPMLKLTRAPDCNVLVYPANGAELKSANGVRTVFTWKQKPSQPEVRFELSGTPDFAKILITQKTKQNYARVAINHPGTYYWRVTDTKTKEHSLVSHFQKVR